MQMDKLRLDTAELKELNQLLDALEGDFANLDSEEALQRATIVAHELPGRIRSALNAFRLEQMSGVLCLSGYVVDQERAGPTPGHWRDRSAPSATHREELLLVLFSSLLGDPFSWATQQNGRLIHDVLPIKGHEHEQLGSSSEAPLTWHTEDAFHPLRGDFLSFACLRNPYAAATTVGYADSLDLTADVRATLFEERFGIRPDESHLAKNNAAASAVTFDGIDEMQSNPELVAVLSGDPAAPYIRADPYFMQVDPADTEAQYALDELVRDMDKKMCDLQLEDGDYCFLDNFRVVHGRKPFKARHDGTDRWLKRVNISRDLRKSRAAWLPGSTRSIS
jgi:Fe(II)/alpha-ketoglutarate-dependent arginine beta-hydroxylase